MTATTPRNATPATPDGGPVDFVSGAPAAGSLEVTWFPGRAGRRRPEDPLIQVHHYDEHTVVLRQSKSVHYEAPFLFLLFGNDRALLLDTGATEEPELFPLRGTVDGLIADWLAAHPRTRPGREPDQEPSQEPGRSPGQEHGPAYELVVAHTHAHHDHVAADGQFAGRAATTVVPHDAEAVHAFFGLDPEQLGRTASFDLGGRVLEVLASPGHHPSAITLHDPWTGILLTGDTVLPGRLFAADAAAYRATLDRLVAFTGTHTVTHVLGCHVEMQRKAGRDYPLGATYQPAERVPQLTPAELTAMRDTVAAVGGRPGIHRFADFVLVNEPRKRDLRRLLVRARTRKALASARAALIRR